MVVVWMQVEGMKPTSPRSRSRSRSATAHSAAQNRIVEESAISECAFPLERQAPADRPGRWTRVRFSKVRNLEISAAAAVLDRSEARSCVSTLRSILYPESATAGNGRRRFALFRNFCRVRQTRMLLSCRCSSQVSTQKYVNVQKRLLGLACSKIHSRGCCLATQPCCHFYAKTAVFDNHRATRYVLRCSPMLSIRDSLYGHA